ncbi:MAG: hypothetical protein AAB920_02570, partial [Patescibacteria group bacterium]
YKDSGMLLEVHLMVTNPELVIDEWLAVGAKRIIVHVESFAGRDASILREISVKCKHNGAELMLSENPNTAVEELFGYMESVDSFHLLAVTPGPSGQEFDERIIKKIEVLREKMPNVIIEIDGGVNKDVAIRARNAGADVVVVALYIFGSDDPGDAFRELESI